MEASFEHLNLLSYSSGHMFEAVAIIMGAMEPKPAGTPPDEDGAFLQELHVIDRGSPAACADVEGAHYCLGLSAVSVSLGLCLPNTCDAQFIEGMIVALATPSERAELERRMLEAIPDYVEDPSLSFSCGDELRVRVDTGAVIVFGLVASLVCLVALGTFIDYNHRKQKQQQQQLHLKLQHHHDLGDKSINTTTTTTSAIKGNGSTTTTSTTAWVPEGSTSNGGGGGNTGIEETKDVGGGQGQPKAGEDAAFVTRNGELLSSGDEMRRPLLSSGGGDHGGAPVSRSCSVSSTDSKIAWYLAGLRQPLVPPPDTAVGTSVEDRLSVEEASYGQQHEYGRIGADRALAQRQRWWRCGRWCGEHLECFSLMVNTDSLLAPPRAGDEFPALDGVRTMSMLWVVLGHTFSYNVTGDGPGFSNTIQVVPQNGNGLLSRCGFSLDRFPVWSGPVRCGAVWLPTAVVCVVALSFLWVPALVLQQQEGDSLCRSSCVVSGQWFK